MKSALIGLLAVASLVFSSQALALGVNTTTYVRCWYKLSSDSTNVETDYVWGMDPATGGDYLLRGNWYQDGAAALQNMFFTDVTPAQLTDVCDFTLANRGISQTSVKISAADSWASLDYTIWSNDPADQSSRINKVVVFGDSVSDTGNLWNGTGWLVPNRNSWFLGHFSNGKVWDEYLSDDLGLPNYNWAVAGAAGDRYLVINGAIEQVASYLSYMDSAPNYRPVNTLFTMLIGGNDIINYGRSAAAAIASEQTALDNLIASGARHIIVGNLPDLWKAPQFKFRSDGAAMKVQIDDFNTRLPAMIASLKAKWGATLKIELLDIRGKINDILANSASYSITNTTDSCLELNQSSTADYATGQQVRAQCVNANAYMFWDLLHPTTRTHSLIGDIATELAINKFPL